MTFVNVQTSGAIGELVLCSPKTLNALSHEAIKALHTGIAQHEANPEVRAIVLRSDTDKALCAGGDVKHVRDAILADQFDAVQAFFTDEYALNLAISQCKKPYIALMNGIVMGGGLGISVHGSVRVVSETSLLAMPESRIGFFPDVGASFFLPRLPYRAGYWLGLTAASVKGHEALQIGLGTHYVHSDNFPALLQAIRDAMNTLASPADSAAHNAVDDVLANLSAEPPDHEFIETLKQRATWFADDDLLSIRERLVRASDAGNADAQHLLSLFDTGSPYSRRITMKLFDDAHGKELKRCLDLELALCAEAVRYPDLVEGIRAVLVDKDNSPAWKT